MKKELMNRIEEFNKETSTYNVVKVKEESQIIIQQLLEELAEKEKRAKASIDFTPVLKLAKDRTKIEWTAGVLVLALLFVNFINSEIISKQKVVISKQETVITKNVEVINKLTAFKNDGNSTEHLNKKELEKHNKGKQSGK